MHIQEKAHWEVELHWFAHAIAAGAQPCEAALCVILRDRDNRQPGLYATHTWLFENLPTRQNFIAALGSAPWSANAYEKDLIPLLQDKRRSQWPIIDCAHKAGSADLLDERGRKIGRIDVRRRLVCANIGYSGIPILLTRDVEAHARQLIRGKGSSARRSKAMKVYRAGENRMLEEALDLALSDGVCVDDNMLLMGVERVWADAGVIKRGSAWQKQHAAEQAESQAAETHSATAVAQLSCRMEPLSAAIASVRRPAHLYPEEISNASLRDRGHRLD